MNFKSSTPLALRLSLFALLFVGFATAGVGQQIHQTHDQLAAEGQKRYGIESAQIKYEYASDAQGFELITFDHWGWREKKVVDKTTTTWGNTASVRSTEYIDGNYAMSLTNNANFCRAYVHRELSNSLKEASKAVEVLHGVEVYKLQGAVNMGKETVLGRECIVYEFPKFARKVWIWEGIVLRSVQTVMDYQIKLEATKIELNITTSDSDFAIPQGVEIKGLPALEE